MVSIHNSSNTSDVFDFNHTARSRNFIRQLGSPSNLYRKRVFLKGLYIDSRPHPSCPWLSDSVCSSYTPEIFDSIHINQSGKCRRQLASPSNLHRKRMFLAGLCIDSRPHLCCLWPSDTVGSSYTPEILDSIHMNQSGKCIRQLGSPSNLHRKRVFLEGLCIDSRPHPCPVWRSESVCSSYTPEIFDSIHMNQSGKCRRQLGSPSNLHRKRMFLEGLCIDSRRHPCCPWPSDSVCSSYTPTIFDLIHKSI